MYCLSQFCCFCFCKNAKLKLLRKITCHDRTFLEVAIDVIPEIQLSGITHVVSICDDCVKYVTEMHTFRQTCIRNSRLLTEYIEQLGSASAKIGTAQVQISDLKTEIIKNIQVDDVVEESKLDDIQIKTEADDSLLGFDFVSTYESAKFHYDEAIRTEEVGDAYEYIDESYNIEKKEDVEIKIEVNDDFNDRYDYEEEVNNYVELDEVFDDKTESKGEADLSPNPSPMNSKISEDEKSEQFACKICGKSFPTQKSLKHHKKIHTKDNECKTCGKFFSTSHVLKRHELIHGDKPFKCETCGVSFVRSSHLKRHAMTHTGEKPYKCETCGKSFALKINLKYHKRSHDVEKPYKCEKCGKSFISLSNLKVHKVSSTKERPHGCDICGKSFFYARDIEKHMLSHTGEKPYKCDVCEKAFSAASSLARHYVVHTGEKLHKCEICGKLFARLYLLKAHGKVHTEGYAIKRPRKKKTKADLKTDESASQTGTEEN